VLTSFAELEHSKERGITLVNSSNLAEYSPPIKLQNLAGGMWVPEVIKIDQRHAIKMFAQWLYETKNIEFQFATQVDAIDAPFVETTTETLEANSIIVCGGDELETLFPDALESEGVIRCQLQMLRTHPQPEGWRLGPFILGGLSIGRYAGFQECDGIAELKRQLEDRYPVHIENGINAIAVQELDGSVTIGDSHKYGKHFSPDRSEEADRLILDYLSERIDLANPGIADRWLGHYAFHPHADIIDIEPQPNVRLVTMTNGQGMTHGLAIAEKNIRNLL
ncbi:MAG: FAD-dependent oxidoreductase, partial [Rhizobiaceae bacterium]